MIDKLKLLMDSPDTVALAIGIFVLFIHFIRIIYYVFKEFRNINIGKCIKDIICKRADALLFPALLIILAILLKTEYEVVVYLKIIPFILGLAITLTLGTLIPIFQNCAMKGIEIEPPTGMEAAFRNITKKSEYGGRYTGILERVLYYIIFVVAWGEAAKFIAAILAFKIAAKWETWKNVVKMPQGNCEGFPDDVSSFIFRRRWGDKVLISFVVGTLSSILSAIVGYGYYEWFLMVFNP